MTVLAVAGPAPPPPFSSRRKTDGGVESQNSPLLCEQGTVPTVFSTERIRIS